MIIKEILNFMISFKKNNLNNSNYKFEDVIEFLSNITNQIPLIMHDWDNIWMYSLIVPKDNLKGNFKDRLLNWSVSPSHYHFNRTHNGIILSKPCDDDQPKEILNNSIPPIIERNLDIRDYTDFDINQILSNSLNLYKSKDTILTCENDDEVGKIFHGDFSICTLSREEIDKFLDLSNSALIRFFDFKIYKNPILSENKQNKRFNCENIYYHNLSIIEDNGYTSLKKIRGFQIIFAEKEYKDLI